MTVAQRRIGRPPKSAHRLTAQEIVDWVTSRFIDTGQDSTIKEIAEAKGVSDNTVRKIFLACNGVPEGLTLYQETRAGRSSNYPMFNAGSYRVSLYGPSRKHLAALLKPSTHQGASQCK